MPDPGPTAPIGNLATLADLQEAFSDYVNDEDVPAEADPLYLRRTRWLNRGREDLSNRWFWNCLLTSDTVAITAGTATYDLPADFTRSNALRVFSTDQGEVLYTDPYDTSGAVLSITRDMTTGIYKVTLNPTPAINDTATVWYYATPTPMSSSTDVCLVDGECTLWYALIQYYFSQGPASFDEMDRATQEYENRIDELFRTEAIHAPGSLGAMQNFEQAHHNAYEKDFYGGNKRRS